MAPSLSSLLVGALAMSTAVAFPSTRRAADKTLTSPPPANVHYDYVVMGGGTTGLTVADRLSEGCPKCRVLVIEYGKVQFAPGMAEPPGTPAGPPTKNPTSFPIQALKGRTFAPIVGMTVGGSSTVNAQVIDRASVADMDAWEKLGNDGWDWKHFFPYYQKSMNFNVPSQESIDEYGYTFDVNNYSQGKSKVQASFPPFQYPMTMVHREALHENLPKNKDCNGGNKIGVCWIPNTQTPATALRSHSGTGHYTEVIDSRDNYDLLVNHKVTRMYVNRKGPPTIEFTSSTGDGTQRFNITPKAEAILSAGAVFTPTILQRSGIGEGAYLKKAGITPTVELPGVGRNFHDHGGVAVGFSYSNVPEDFTTAALKNATYLAEAVAEYKKSPPQGPFTVGLSTGFYYESLPKVTPDYKQIKKWAEQQLKSGDYLKYLPKDTPRTVQAGYKEQFKILIKQLSDTKTPSLESLWDDFAFRSLVLLKPFSRGYIMVNPEDPEADPVVEYGSASNPLDLELMARFIGFARKTFTAKALERFSPVETAPGANVTAVEDLKEYIREKMVPSFQHPCCTAPMMPKNKGGVVDDKLKVYGVKGLRIADISIVPLLPGTHTQSLAYAIGEKAADLILRANNCKKARK